jgi:hypothetical protein
MAPIKLIEGNITSSPSLTYKSIAWNNPSVQLDIVNKLLGDAIEKPTPWKLSVTSLDENSLINCSVLGPLPN